MQISTYRPVVISLGISCLLHILVLINFADISKKNNATTVAPLVVHIVQRSSKATQGVHQEKTSKQAIVIKKNTNALLKTATVKHPEKKLTKLTLAVNNLPPTELKNNPIPIQGASLPTVNWVETVSARKLLNIDRANYVNYQQINLRQNQIQQLIVQLDQVSNRWEKGNDIFDTKCRLQLHLQSMDCEDEKVDKIIEQQKQTIFSILQTIQTLGQPANGVLISYHEGHYNVSLLNDIPPSTIEDK